MVGIGASAGGVEAVSELLRCLPPDTGLAFVVVQHLDPERASRLPEVLGAATRMPVAQARDGLRLEADHVYVIPPNTELSLRGASLKLGTRRTRPGRPAMPIDTFLRSLAEQRQARALGVVLSGTASDGTEGLRAIQERDGITFVQDPRSARFAGMPQSAIGAGAADRVLVIPELARELVRLSRHPYVAPSHGDEHPTPEEEALRDEVRARVRSVVGIDFTEYKPASFERRLARRMALRELRRLADYVELLRASRSEVEALAEDLLVHVTSFFRDEAAFDLLKKRVFPRILEAKAEGAPVRMWVPGCSTGEEAYSIAIALFEGLDQARRATPVQIFATDVSERAVQHARAGLYPESALRGLGEERRRRYFVGVEGGYRVNKTLRDACVFVRHDLARDPPFSKLDLVSCRNVLIYFASALQKRVVATFHYALNEPGFLLLGRSENPTGFARLFSPVDRALKLYARTALPSRLHVRSPASMQPLSWPAAAHPALADGRPSREVAARADRVLLARYGPPAVIVNERMEILQFRGRTGPYLEPAPGQPQNNLLKMARVGLIPALRAALAEARKGSVTVRKEAVRFDDNGAMRICSVVVVPLAEDEAREGLFLVLFEPAAPREGQAPAPPSTRPARAEERLRARQVEEELSAARVSLQAAMEEHGRGRDELTSANEDLVSANEELQSLNEEHEAAKEELQSANEELTTLNDELQARNLELGRVNGDLHNLLDSVHLPVLIVDAQRCIRRFTADARRVLNVLPADVGRPLGELHPNLGGVDLDAHVASVIASGRTHAEEVRGLGGRWQRLEIRPYLTAEGKTDGAVVSLVDVDDLKRAVDAAVWSRDFATRVVETVQVPLVVLDRELRTVSMNRAFRHTFGDTPEDKAGARFFEVNGGAWDLPPLRTALEDVLARHARLGRMEVEIQLAGRGGRTVSVSVGPIEALVGPPLILVAAEDITERAHLEGERQALLAAAQAAREDAERANGAKDQFLANLSHELRTPLSAMLLHAQILQRGPASAEKVRHAAEVIERNTRAQAQLIEDLLDVSRIVTGKLVLSLEPVDLGQVVRAAAEVVAPAAEQKGQRVELQLEEGVRVMGDPVRLKQVVWNLFTNATKFTPKGGVITISVAPEGDRARLSVRDTGSGIAPAFLPRMFDRFAQGDSSATRVHGGLGLGLSILLHVVDLHGGTVRAESPGPGQGATFTVALPLLADAQAGVSAPAANPPSEQRAAGTGARLLAGVRVLLVDDDLDTRDVLAEVLTESGAQAVTAASAAAGLAALGRFPADVVITDMAMPDEDGYALLRQVRALLDPAKRTLPVIALTATASEADRARAADAGFQLHLEKPVSAELLLGAVRDLARRRSSSTP